MKLIYFLLFFIQYNFAQEIPNTVQKLMKAYPNQIIGFKDNKLVFKDNSTLLYNDFKTKTSQELLDHPDVEDQFVLDYQLGNRNDAGRYRDEAFFKKIYGNTKQEVERKLVEIVWCPKLVNQKIKVTTVNGIDKKLQKISEELDDLPKFKKYITNIGGTFNWRNIAETNRLSMHSFGMTVDINVNYSNYWQWDCNCQNENTIVTYRNKIPLEIVKVFEKYGFIWGGNWLHYDTMHFEYRPELLD
jgi:hypothetical protein